MNTAAIPTAIPAAPVANLLIVDDVPENLLGLEALLRQGDRAVYQASSGEAALELLLQHEFALAILDVQMPGMTGLELAELMRGMEKTRGIPIVFVSAGAEELNYAFKGYESGAVDFLYKPLDAHAMRSKASAFIEMHRQRQRQAALLAQLEATQLELQRAIEIRDVFMSVVAHELRTPLGTLRLQAQLRRRMADGAALSAEKLRSMVERDEKQITNILRLIDDMLDVSRIQRGTLSVEPQASDMAALVRRVVEGFADHATVAGCMLELTAPAALPGYWDEFRLEQVVANLLTNAMRYGKCNPVRIEVSTQDGMAVVAVRDNGVGIAPQDQLRIFAQFERAGDPRLAPGLGLGLHISHEIVQAHGGTLAVSSIPGQGATFTMRVPRDRRGRGAAGTDGTMETL